MDGTDRKAGEGTLRERLELWSALLLAAATVATAFSAYQSTRWSGVQATDFTEAGANRTESAKAQSEGFSFVTIDAALFTDFAVAFFHNDQDLEDFIEKRLFRAEFRPAFNAWVKQKPLTNPKAAQNPFQLKQYRPKKLVQANKLEAKATALFDQGREANQNSDDYVLATIFFASVLFFAGLASKFKSDRVAMGTLAFGTMVLAIGIVRLASLPFH